MINWKLIFKTLGFLLFIEAGLLLLCLIVSMLYGESIMPFLPSLAVSLLLGGIGTWHGKEATATMSRKDGYIVVSSIWFLFSVVGMFPFLIDGCLPDVASAFFETMSGFTSTGATVIDDVDSVSHGLLFWRSLTQWVGGIGIVFFTIAILPAFGMGEVKLFAAESTGPLHDKVRPRISMAVRWIGSVYMMLTVLCLLSLLLCGMNLFDAVNYAMCCTATGGYGTHSAMLHDQYNSAAIEYVLTFFMFFSGVNYALIYYTILKGKIRQFFHDAEAHAYLLIVLSASVICAVTLVLSSTTTDIELAIRESLFTVVSLQTTTGFASCDYTLWPVQLMPVLLFVMFAGACSGSTTGGFKCVRLSILYRIVRNEFTRILYPSAIVPVRLNKSVVSPNVTQTLIGFITLFVVSLFVGAYILAIFGVDPNDVHPNFNYYEAFGLALSSLCNVGPGLEYYGPAHSWMILSAPAKYVCSFLMLIGRLEIFPIMLLFSKAFWKK